MNRVVKNLVHSEICIFRKNAIVVLILLFLNCPLIVPEQVWRKTSNLSLRVQNVDKLTRLDAKLWPFAISRFVFVWFLAFAFCLRIVSWLCPSKFESHASLSIMKAWSTSMSIIKHLHTSDRVAGKPSNSDSVPTKFQCYSQRNSPKATPSILKSMTAML